MAFERPPLGKLLLDCGIITQEQLQRALAYQRTQGCRVGEALIDLGLCGEAEIVRALSEQDGLRFVDLDDTPPTAQALQLVPHELALDLGVVPIRIENGRLLVAARDPHDLRVDETLARTTGLELIVAAGPPTQLQAFLRSYEAPEAPPGSAIPGAEFADAGDRRLLTQAEHPRSVRALGVLLAEALRREASEIFVEPGEGGLRVRLRVDGQTVTLPALPGSSGAGILPRLKLLCGVPLLPVRRPVQGSFHHRLEGASVEFSATFLPGDPEDLAVLRAVIAAGPVPPPEALGLAEADLPGVFRLLARRRGLLLISGAGPERATTLASLANHLGEMGLHTLALDQTLERRLTGVGQVILGEGNEASYAEALRVCCEQNPDAVVVGELPTAEALNVAVRAAETGQLIIAGTWASDSASALRDLLDRNPDRLALAASLSGILAHRRVRKVCRDCARPHTLTFQFNQALRSAFGDVDTSGFRRGAGCRACNFTGYRGTMPIYDFFELDDALRSAIARGSSGADLACYIRERYACLLEQDAFRLAAAGVIAPEEILLLGMTTAEHAETLEARMRLTQYRENEDTPADFVEPGDELEIESWDELAGAFSVLV